MSYRPNFGTRVSDLDDISAAGLGGPALTDVDVINRAGTDYRATVAARQALFRRSPAGSRTITLVAGATTAILTAADNDKIVVLLGGVASTLATDGTVTDGFSCRVRNRTGSPLAFNGITPVGGATTLPTDATCVVGFAAAALEAIPFGTSGGAGSVATSSAPGVIKPDGTSTVVAADGALSVVTVTTGQLPSGPGLTRRDLIALTNAANQVDVRYGADDLAAYVNTMPWVRLFGGIGDGSVHTVATAPADHPLAGVTTLVQLAAIKVAGTTPFSFVTDAAFAGSVWALTDAKVPRLDLDWLAIQASLWRTGMTTLPRGIWVVGSSMPLPLLIRESSADDPSIYGNPVHLVGEGQTVSVIKAGSDFGAGVPLVACGTPSATKANGLGRYNRAGIYTSRLAHLGLLGPAAATSSAMGTLPSAMTGLAWGARLSVEFCQINGFAKAIDIVGDGRGAAFRCVSTLTNGYGAYWSDPNASLAGDIDFQSCSFAGSTIGALGVHGNATILGATFSGKTYLTGAYGIFGETGGSGAPLLSAVRFEKLVAGALGNAFIHDENGLQAGAYTNASARDCRNVLIQSVGGAWDNGKFWGGGGRGRVAWIDCRSLENVVIDNMDTDSVEYSPTQGPSGPAPVALLRVRTVSGAAGGARIRGDIVGLCKRLAANAARFLPDDASNEGYLSFGQTGSYSGRLMRYARLGTGTSSAYELVDGYGNGCCISGAVSASAPVAGVGIMAGVSDGGIMPVVTDAPSIPVRAAAAPINLAGPLSKHATLRGLARPATGGDNPVFGRINGYDSATQLISTSLGGVQQANPLPVVLPTAFVAARSRPVAPLKYLGVNVDGLSFGNTFPGAANTDYFVPRQGTVDYWAARGCTCLRLPFRWERVQPVLRGPLAPDYLGYVTSFVRYAATKGISVIVDVHNYTMYNNKSFTDAGGPTSADFADLWGKLAATFAGDPLAIFGLMNEPAISDATAWLAICGNAIAAIRAAGATQLILFAPCGGGQLDWLPTDGANTYPSALPTLDPLNNLAVEVHRYWDLSYSGTDVVAPGTGFDPILLLSGMTGWARRYGFKAFLGETGFDRGPLGLLAMSNCLSYLQKNSDVWIGCTLWGAGPGWDDNYVYALEPAFAGPMAGVDRVQTRVLQRFTKGGPEYGVARSIPGPKLTPGSPVFGPNADPAQLACLTGGYASFSSKLLQYKSSLTVSARVLLTKPTNYAFVFGLFQSLTLNVGADGLLGFTYGVLNKPFVDGHTTVQIADGVPHHVTICADHTGVLVFCDGRLVGSATGAFSPAWSEFGVFCSGVGNGPAAGGISQFAVFDTALYSATNPPFPSLEPLTGTEPALILYAPLDGDLRTYV